MKKYYCLILIVCYVIFFSACKKNISIQPSETNTATDPLSSGKGISIPVTREELSIIRSWVKQKKINSAEDFIEKVRTLTSARGNNIPGNAIEKTARLLDEPDYSPYEDNVDAAIYTPQFPASLIDINIGAGYIYYNSHFENLFTYSMRGNQVLVRVSYRYYYTLAPDNNNPSGKIWGFQAAAPIQLLPAGGHWGVVTPGGTWYLNSGPGTDPFGNSVAIDAYVSAEEKRTLVRSTTGALKISTNVDLEVFEIGGELEAGFTIESASHTYNQYSMNIEGDVYVNPTGNPYYSNTFFVGTFSSVQYGIQRNY